jgi:hypothetical protein
MSIKYSKSTPVWIKKLANKTVKLLAPEWDIVIDMVDDVDPKCPEKKAEIDYDSDYLTARIQYEKQIKNNKDGRELVIHEILHLILSRMGTAAKRLVSNNVVLKTAWHNYEGAEEEAVVKLSRLLLALIDKTMLNSTK